MPRPPNGTYQFTTTGPNVTTVTYVLSDQGLETTFGVLVWEGTEFRRGSIAIEFLTWTSATSGTFMAVQGMENLPGVFRKVA